jgi:hypothetical protein
VLSHRRRLAARVGLGDGAHASAELHWLAEPLALSPMRHHRWREVTASALRFTVALEHGCAAKTRATAPRLKAVVLTGSMVSGMVKSRSQASSTVGSMPGPDQLSGFNLPKLIALLVILAVVFAPLVFCRGRGPGSSDADLDAGGGGGPQPPPQPSAGSPRGGIPLEHWQPARARLRTHEQRGELKPARARRTAREPTRTPEHAAPSPLTRLGYPGGLRLASGGSQQHRRGPPT